MKHQVLALTIVLTGILVAGAPSGKVSGDAAVTAMYAKPFADQPSNCVDCAECILNGDIGHKAYAGDRTSVSAPGTGTHSECRTVVCSTAHPLNLQGCGQTGGGGEGLSTEDLVADLEAVRVALSRGNVDEAIRLAAAGDDHVVYNKERNAIQAFGCKHVLVAHFALD